MPIYDMNQAGQIVSELRSLYDMNPAGEIVSKIGKVYDNDGTTDHLIYSAEQVLYDHGQQLVPWQVLSQGSGGYVTFNSDNIQLSNTTWQKASVATVSPVALAGYSSLKVQLTMGRNTYGGGRFAGLARPAKSDGDFESPPTASVYGSSQSPAEYTLTVDLGGRTGSYYIILATSITSESSLPWAQIYKVWLE